MNLTEADMLADAGMGLGALAPPSKKKIARKGPAKLTGQQKLMAKGKTPEEQMSEPLYPAASKTKPDKKEYAGSDLSKVAGQEVSGLDEPKAGDWAKGGSTTGSEWAKAQLELAKMLAAKGIPKEQTTQVAQQVAEKAKDITDKKFLGLSKKGWVGAGIGLLVAAAIAVGYYALTKAGDKAGADELLAKGASKTTSAQQATGDIATSVGTKTATTATKGADVAQQATSDVATSTGAKAASTAAKVVDATTPLTTDYASKVSKNLAKIGEILKTDQEKGKMYLDKLGTAMAAANSEGKLTDNAALEALSKVMPSEKAEGWWNTAKLGFEMRNKL
jgi:hypothetical protein